MPVGEQNRRYYAGLVPLEGELWRRWLKDHETEYTAFEYNVRVGKGAPGAPKAAPPGSPLADALARMWTMITQLRIDVVAWNGAEPWIYEVKLAPGHGALGQLITYRQLLADDRGLEVLPQLGLVCEQLSDDLVSSYQAQGITIYVLPRGEGAPVTVAP